MLSHAPRQFPSWLIFDVGQKMNLRSILPVAMVSLVAACTSPPDKKDYALDVGTKQRLVCESHRLVYSVYSEPLFGGSRRNDHYLLLHREVPDFESLRIQLDHDGLPSLKVGKTRFPMGRPGVYFVTKTRSGFAVRLIQAGLPIEAIDAITIPDYICEVFRLDLSREGKPLIEVVP